ncbi:MAG: excinuclease ABC subunit UvrA [Verrucomicrobiota bacterium]
MSKSSPPPAIRLRGVRQNNLKGFDLDLPQNQLIVVTGLSGSGKSSLAFDTLFAEGQRRYIETFSPYARQFFDRMDKPQVDRIEGIPPAIAIEQRNSVRTTRSTVGTMTEICDYMKVLWPHLARLHCRSCGRPVRKEAPGDVYARFEAVAAEVLVAFDLPLSDKLSLQDSLALVAKQGYQRLLVDGRVIRLEEAAGALSKPDKLLTLTLVQDRLRAGKDTRARFVEACEQAYHFGKGKLAIHTADPQQAGAWKLTRRFSNRLHCADCDLDYRDPSTALFSFNHPLGACPSCKGFGRIITIDFNLAIPDRSLTLAAGAVKPWRSGFSAECQKDLARFCKKRGVPMDVPFNRLPAAQQKWVLEGDAGYGSDKAHEWPNAWYGVQGYFRWLEGKSYKMHVRVLLSRYRSYVPCPDCRGARFQPDALLYRLDGAPESGKGMSLAEFYQLQVQQARPLLESFLKSRRSRSSSPSRSPVTLALEEVVSRLQYLDQVGLGYLTLDRPTRSLSGGETERVNLTTCLGTRLVHTLFVLDEPSVGLHARDTERLVEVLLQLRSAGNTVVVVEHEPAVMRAADQVIDLGPGHGASGGSVQFQGAYPELLRCAESLTGQYLSGRRRQDRPPRRSVAGNKVPWLIVHEATAHNLKGLRVDIPLQRLVCLSGVSGSGKSTLLRDILLPALQQALHSTPDSGAGADEETDSPDPATPVVPAARLEGCGHLARAVWVDQSSLGRTPRSNPAVYIGAFEEIRDVFAQTEGARRRGLNSSAFSFNSGQGQCERCRGAGFEKIEMQFLSDVFVRCPECNGRRYRPHILEVKLRAAGRDWSIADLLESTVDEAVGVMAAFEGSRAAARARQRLALLQEVGLGYLSLGQPVNTLSGGESQRLKLVRHLVDASVESRESRVEGRLVAGARPSTLDSRPTLFLFDEPTTGLHFEDVRVLLKVFQRLVDAGHSVLVVEHNLDVIRAADWVIDLGPEAAERGGTIVAAGPPEVIMACEASHTGRALGRSRSRKGRA